MSEHKKVAIEKKQSVSMHSCVYVIKMSTIPIDKSQRDSLFISDDNVIRGNSKMTSKKSSVHMKKNMN